MELQETSFRKKIFHVIDDHKSKKFLNKIFHGVLFSLIIISTTNLVLESIDAFQYKYWKITFYLEVFTIVFFTLEYILRLYTCVEITKFNSPIMGRLKYAIEPLMIIDLLSILPMYFFLATNNTSSFYVFGVFRILRLFKAIRYINAFRIIGQVFYIKREQLLISFTFIFFTFVFYSFLIFVAESNAQPKVFKNIPSAMWYTISTITTVGYGDIVAITPFGKIVSGIMGISGWLLFAIPTSILTSGFLKINIHEKKDFCPNCGERQN